jgi:hypothetical protein
MSWPCIARGERGVRRRTRITFATPDSRVEQAYAQFMEVVMNCSIGVLVSVLPGGDEIGVLGAAIDATRTMKRAEPWPCSLELVP